MPSDFSVYLTRLLMPGADTLSSFAAPPIVPVTITARMTSTWRNVIMCSNSEDKPERYSHGSGAFARSGYQIPRRVERAPGPGLRIHRLRKLGGRDFDADRDIRRHGAGQRDQVDAAFAGKHPLVTGGMDHFFRRSR